MSHSNPTAAAHTLIPLNQSPSEFNVFCLHTAGGGVSFYQGLAKELSDVAAFVGLEDPALHTQFDYTSLSDLAHYHSYVIQAHQSHGPYYLMGYCSGGPLAFETAYQLESQGKEVAGIALFGDHVLGFDDDDDSQYQFLGEYLFNRFNLSLPEVNWKSLETKSVDEVVEIVSEQIASKSLPGISANAGWIKKGLRSLLLSRKASRVYQPESASFDVDLFQRHVNWDKTGPISPWCDWGNLTRGQLRTIAPPPVQDGLDDILFPPYLADTANKLRTLTLQKLTACASASQQPMPFEECANEQATEFLANGANAVELRT